MDIQLILGAALLLAGWLLWRLIERQNRQRAAAAAVFESPTLKLWMEPDGLHGEVKRSNGRLTRCDWGHRKSTFTLVDNGAGSFQQPMIMAPFTAMFRENTTSHEVQVDGTPSRIFGQVDANGNVVARVSPGHDSYRYTVTRSLGTIQVSLWKSHECKMEAGTHFWFTLKPKEAAALQRWMKRRPHHFLIDA